MGKAARFRFVKSSILKLSVGGAKSIRDMFTNRQAGWKTTTTNNNALAFQLCCFLPAVFQQQCTVASNAVNLKHHETRREKDIVSVKQQHSSSLTQKLPSFNTIANDFSSAPLTSPWRPQTVDLTQKCCNFNAKKLPMKKLFQSVVKLHLIPETASFSWWWNQEATPLLLGPKKPQE